MFPHLHSSASDQLRYLLNLAEPLLPESIEYMERLHNPVADVYARHRIARCDHVAEFLLIEKHFGFDVRASHRTD